MLIFAGLVGACLLCFKLGVLIKHFSGSTDAREAKDGKGYIVRVIGMQSLAAAKLQSDELRNRYGAPVEVETAPAGDSFLIKVGPLEKLSDAERIENYLRASHNSIVRIIHICGTGTSDCGLDQQLRRGPSGALFAPDSNST